MFLFSDSLIDSLSLLPSGGSDVVSLDLCQTAQYVLSIVSYEPTFFHILLDGEQALGSISTFENTGDANSDNDQGLAFDFEEVSFLIGPGGIQTRERPVIQQPNFLGEECPALFEYQVRWVKEKGDSHIDRGFGREGGTSSSLVNDVLLDVCVCVCVGKKKDGNA